MFPVSGAAPPYTFRFPRSNEFQYIWFKLIFIALRANFLDVIDEVEEFVVSDQLLS
jgi:hypothetical protein